MTKSMQTQAYVTPALATEFVSETNSLYGARLSEDFGKEYDNKIYASSVANGLIHLSRVPKSESKQVRWCICSAIVDATENFVNTYLKSIHFLTEEEEGDICTETDATIDSHKGENYVTGRIKGATRMYFGFAPSELNNIPILTMELQKIINQVQEEVNIKLSMQ
ncbi:hypothetical protein [Bacillus cereus group sp. BfR-BA-01318]|uniref:hypothetical protein n=1 Tax=unclassified Bacillus cereus group TaxID=2750818 RepID=UPI001298CCD9|nr:hypothetical protein [Bacillus cereus group sp. BfR-BA-01318]MEB9419906.1 hypothetical protein [Bacillus cereus]MRD20718.1 hypothetical protein [Bacillus thuringiensis]